MGVNQITRKHTKMYLLGASGGGVVGLWAREEHGADGARKENNVVRYGAREIGRVERVHFLP
jgi:hypothetical protein